MIQPQLFKDINSSNLFRPPLRYPGSKYGAIKIIKNFLPKESINDYCEPFFGSGAFFFKLIETAKPLLVKLNGHPYLSYIFKMVFIICFLENKLNRLYIVNEQKKYSLVHSI